MSDEYVQHYELEWVQEQIYALERKIDDLQMENTLLRNDLNTIKTEGCWHFVKDPEHKHE